MGLPALFFKRMRELAAIQRESGLGRHVAPDSTPVLFFGEIERADVVTVGINPSWHEFLTRAHESLPVASRRFAHLSDLSGDEERDADIALAKMQGYFRLESNAYWPWFNHVERLVNDFGSSLKDGTAAHTDVLSCFATDPAWGKLKPRERDPFSRSGYETFLEVMGAAVRLRTLVLFGATARKELEAKAHVTFEPVPTPLDRLRKLATFRPVLSRAVWALDGRSLTVVAIGPYRSVPTSPMSREEVSLVAGLAKEGL